MHVSFRARSILVPALGALLLLSSGPLASGAPKKKQKPGVPDKEMQKAIDEAVERGAEWLRKHQSASGQLGVVKHGGAAYYGIGSTALGGLALLAAGDEQGDEVLDKAMAYCRKKDEEGSGARTTYDAGTVLMFAHKYFGHPEGKKPKKKRGPAGPANPLGMPEDALGWIRSLANFLVDQQKQETGDWGYPQNRPDFSNTQYALLGLRAAKDSGIAIAPGVWLRVLDRAMDAQQKDGPKVKRTTVPEEEGGTVYVVESDDRSRGWPYTADSNVATGSMTTAGIAILAIAHDGLVNPRKFPSYKPSRQLEVAQAVQDGFAWLEANFAVDKNPGSMAPNWHYYYLYGLERAGVLGGRDLLGQHDWYIEGAKYLLQAQKSDGRWASGALGTAEYEASDILDTAWAILFLKRATHPLDSPMPVVTK